MIRDAVLEPQGDTSAVVVEPTRVPRAAATPVAVESAPAGPALVEPDVVGGLLDALRRPGSALDPPTPRSRRPLDVQYWACWAAVALALALVTGLLVLG